MAKQLSTAAVEVLSVLCLCLAKLIFYVVTISFAANRIVGTEKSDLLSWI